MILLFYLCWLYKSSDDVWISEYKKDRYHQILVCLQNNWAVFKTLDIFANALQNIAPCITSRGVFIIISWICRCFHICSRCYQIHFTYFKLMLFNLLQDGKVSQLEHVFIRGSKVRCVHLLRVGEFCLCRISLNVTVDCCRFMVIPDMLKNAPMFKRLEARIKVLYLLHLSIFSSHWLLYSWCCWSSVYLWRARVHLLE